MVEERGRVPDLPDGTEKHKARPNPRRDPETRTPNSDPDPGWEAEERLHNQNARAHAALAVVDLDTERHRCLATLLQIPPQMRCISKAHTWINPEYCLHAAWREKVDKCLTYIWASSHFF